MPPSLRLGLVATAAVAALVLPSSAGAFVYWANYNLGLGTTIGRANLDGSWPNPNFITDTPDPTGMAVDGQHVYWTNAIAGTIGRANLDGSGADRFFVAGANAPVGVAVDGQHVYWTNQSAGPDGIGRANLDGTGVEGSFITGASGPEAVAVDGQHIYWANASANTIGRANLDGSSPDQSFISLLGVPGPAGVAVDGQHIYWTDDDPGVIGRANLDGTAVDRGFIAAGDSNPRGVAVDGQHIYWANLTANTIGRANLDGSSPDPGFITGPSPWGLAVDSLPDATSTALACSPAAVTVPASTSCTATVGNTGAAPSAPTGTVAFSSSGAGSFGSPASCSLVASGGARSACRIAYTPGATGAATITAAYSGDATNAASNGTAPLTVLGSQSGARSFRLARTRLHKRRGTATITVRIPGPGRLVLRGPAIEKRTKRTSHAGKLRLTVKPRNATRRRLERTGRASVRARVTYTPRGGEARTRSKRIALKLRGRR